MGNSGGNSGSGGNVNVNSKMDEIIPAAQVERMVNSNTNSSKRNMQKQRSPQKRNQNQNQKHQKQKPRQHQRKQHQPPPQYQAQYLQSASAFDAAGGDRGHAIDAESEFAQLLAEQGGAPIAPVAVVHHTDTANAGQLGQY